MKTNLKRGMFFAAISGIMLYCWAQECRVLFPCGYVTKYTRCVPLDILSVNPYTPIGPEVKRDGGYPLEGTQCGWLWVFGIPTPFGCGGPATAEPC